jgi:glycosyltransferase involved in cell wall biosynthesis
VAAPSRDREFKGALIYGIALAATAVIAYVFNALMGRRLSSQDFGTFGALLAALIALSGPTTALYGGAAMTAARSGAIPRAHWRWGVAAAGVAAALVAFLPLPAVPRAVGWFGLACAMWMIVSWNRGLLIGLGRLGTVGGTVIFEGLARLSIAFALVARGWGVAGASAGLALGIAAAAILTELLLPRDRFGKTEVPAGDVWMAVIGLFFLSLIQFPDIIAVRLINPAGAGGYMAASSLARMALYAQAPAAAYALKRTALVGARRSLGRALVLALAPASVAGAILLTAPKLLLRVTYGGRYLESVGLVRILTVAMLLAGMALVLFNALLGAGRTAWAWPMAIVAVAGIGGVFSVAAASTEAAVAMLACQAVVLLVGFLFLLRLLDAERPGDDAVVIMNWRDSRHPQGGGSEVYVEEMARRLAGEGRRVTIFCADHGLAPREEIVHGVRFVRRGSWRTVYLWGAVYHLLGRFGPHDAVVDVQNAIPFFTPIYCGRRVVALVHHVHREQWEMLFKPSLARRGWWVESRLSPRLYRKATYVAVSNATKADLVNLGVDAERIHVVHNGSHEPRTSTAEVAKSAHPSLVYVGRLVPHKRVELLLDAVALLHDDYPNLRVRIVGQGPWEGHLREAADALGLTRSVSFEGFVDEATRDRMLAEAWILVLPSVKEGWGLAVVEAAAQATPAVGFRVGGLQESIVDEQTGLLASDVDSFREALRRLVASEELRTRLGRAARARMRGFTWDLSAEAFASVLDARPAPARDGEPRITLVIPDVEPAAEPV